MLFNKIRIVDSHYHIISLDLAKKIAESVSTPSRYAPQKGASRTTMGTEVSLLTEEEQLAIIGRSNIDTLWVSVRTPRLLEQGMFPPSSPHYLTLCRTINDHLASICRRYLGRFVTFADIPVNLGEAAIEEMERALNNLGLERISLQSSYDNKLLDTPKFRLFFEEANRQKAKKPQ